MPDLKTSIASYVFDWKLLFVLTLLFTQEVVSKVNLESTTMSKSRSNTFLSLDNLLSSDRDRTRGNMVIPGV